MKDIILYFQCIEEHIYRNIKKGNKMTKDEAIKLKSDVNAILKKAHTEFSPKHDYGIAVNWVRVRCVCICETRDLLKNDDKTFIRIIIIKADPNNGILIGYIYDELRNMGWDTSNIEEISMEW